MIVLAADDIAFFELRYCVSSIEDKASVVIYDLGLSRNNLEWLNINGLKVVRCHLPEIKHIECKKFLKPFVLDDLPDGNFLYCDTDIIFSSRFEFEARGFMVFKEPAYCRNPQELRLNDEALDIYNVNSGYIYFSKPKDNWLINEWCAKTLELSCSHQLDLPHSYDQGILQYVLESNSIKASNDGEINHNPVRDLLNPDIDIVAQVREYQTDELASHFAGSPKLSHLATPNHQLSISGLRSCKGDVNRIKLVVVTDDIKAVRIALKQGSAWYNNYYMTSNQRHDVHADILITDDHDMTKHDADIYVSYTNAEINAVRNMIYIHPFLSPRAIIPLIKMHYDIPFRSEFIPQYVRPVSSPLSSYTERIYMSGKYI